MTPRPRVMPAERTRTGAALPHRTADEHQLRTPGKVTRPGPGPETLQRVLDGLYQL